MAAWQVSVWAVCGVPVTAARETTAAGAPAPARPTLLVSDSVNQRLPSAPVAMPTGPLVAVGVANSVMS